jgi:hypothetical protein
MTTATTIPTGTPTPMFTRAQWRALRALRRHFRQDRDLFSEQECARLEFLRWLHRSGQLEP